MTYKALGARANQLAHRLRKLGAGPDVPVAICLERGAEALVALLGVMRSGGACLPLDPEYPASRLAAMLGDSRAPILVTQESLATKLTTAGTTQLLVDVQRDEIAGESMETPHVAADDRHLAYIIYTSGSTGRPKGVMVTHGVYRNITEWTRGTLPSAARTLQYTSFSFDVSFQEIALTWGTGGTLVTVSEAVRRDPGALAEYLMAHRVERLFLPFVALQRLAEACLSRPSLELALRDVVTAGEQLRVTPEVRAWFGTLGGCRLHNHYGPSETHVATGCTLGGDPGLWPQLPPIGRAIDNVSIRLLDDQLREVPQGDLGELYAGDAGPGRGYLGRPGLTAERYLPDPFLPGARMYRTGDLARRTADGSLEFAGRVDDQVKVRGFRVEPGEVEAVLSRHPHCREVAVAAVTSETGPPRLAAFVVPRGSAGADPGELRAFLAAKLPDYMVPSHFQVVQHLPLTPSGKVDRRALQAGWAGRARAAQNGGHGPARTLEEVLGGLWREVLETDAVDSSDDFFALGGDSVRGAILVNRLQARLGEYVYLTALFEAPTLAGLATYLERHYAGAVDRMLSRERDGAEPPAHPGATVGAVEGKLAALRGIVALLPARPPAARRGAARIPRTVFVLSPPRSGSTLLRVVLGGHPGLFAPPELDLLSFGTMSERAAALSGRDSFRLEGAVRAVMELRGCGADEARGILREMEEKGAPTSDLYRLLAEWSAGRTLVDKSTPYALDLEVLRRAETEFEEPVYLHLLRHPLGMIRSFEEVRLDRLFVRGTDGFGVRELAELIWLASHRNLLRFEREVPRERWLRVRYEELAERPREVAEEICAALGIAFHPGMLEPYGDRRSRMTDGLHERAESRMVGDPRFHEHDRIDPTVAHRWKKERGSLIFEETGALAAELGYTIPPAGPAPRGDARERVESLSAGEVEALLAQLGHAEERA